MPKKAKHPPEPEDTDAPINPVSYDVALERDDLLTDYIDPNQLDAPCVDPGVLSDDPKPADLTHVLNGLWPGNPPNRTGNWYFDLNRLSMEPGQSALFGNIIANFVFERADVHCINAVSSECRIELFTEMPDFKEGRLNLGWFTVSGKRTWRETNGHDDLSGTYMSGQPLYIQIHDPLPDSGRIVINLVGYLIEPWR